MLDGEAGCQVNLFPLMALSSLLSLGQYVSTGQEHCGVWSEERYPSDLSAIPLASPVCWFWLNSLK